MTRRRLAIAFGALIFLVLDVSLGTLRRVVVDWNLDRVARNAGIRDDEFRVSHPFYHHDFTPKYDGTTFWGPIQYTFHTNSLGFRDVSTREVPLRTEQFRFLLIGDSFTEGLGVDYESTFAGILAKKYAAAGAEILDAGVVSYSPAIYWKKVEFLLERRGLQFNAVVLLLDLSDIQDEAWSYRINEEGNVIDAPEIRPSLLARWNRNSLTWRATAKAVRLLYPHPL